jgi:hypothetical protein
MASCILADGIQKHYWRERQTLKAPEAKPWCDNNMHYLVCLSMCPKTAVPKTEKKWHNKCLIKGNFWVLPDTLPDTPGGDSLAPKPDHEGGLELLASRV